MALQAPQVKASAPDDGDGLAQGPRFVLTAEHQHKLLVFLFHQDRSRREHRKTGGVGLALVDFLLQNLQPVKGSRLLGRHHCNLLSAHL